MVTQRAEFHAENDLVAATGNGTADEGFIMPHAVEVPGIDHRDPRIERRLNGGHRTGIILSRGGGVKVRDAHGPKADFGNHGALRAERMSLHGRDEPEPELEKIARKKESRDIFLSCVSTSGIRGDR